MESLVMRGESWPVEQIELLKRLWAAGATAVAIGERLGGKSRSAVLGKIFRLRLDAAPARGRKTIAAPAGQHSAAPSRRRRRHIKRPPIAPKPLTQRKSLLELTNATCRWPHGRPGAPNFFFCGLPEADLEQGIPYCAKHMRRAYSPAISVGTARPTAQFPVRAAGR
jgi:GcrA cell cycle regulator